MVNSILGDKDENYNIPKGGRYDFFDVYAYPRGQFSDNMCATTSGNNIDCLNITIQLPGVGVAFSNPWGYVYSIREMQKSFNALLDSTLLKRCTDYLFYTPTIGLDMLEPYATAGLGRMVPISSVNQK